MTNQPKMRVFSGMQPTANVHIGNYLGAMKRFVSLQHEAQSLFCVMDMHAITVPQDPGALKAQTREIAASYLAAGVDPDIAIVFVQSTVSAHAELTWILSCVARMGWLERMTQFKDKAGKNSERASVGLFTYPVLMAADILAYKATHVPVGEDQKQHLELARDVAIRFNSDFKVDGFFTPPEILIERSAARVMNLQDGTKKMSKSDPADNSRINMTDSVDVIAKKMKRAKTDTLPMPSHVDELKDRAVAHVDDRESTGRQQDGGRGRPHLQRARRLQHRSVHRLVRCVERLHETLGIGGVGGDEVFDGQPARDVAARMAAEPIGDDRKACST